MVVWFKGVGVKICEHVYNILALIRLQTNHTYTLLAAKLRNITFSTTSSQKYFLVLSNYGLHVCLHIVGVGQRVRNLIVALRNTQLQHGTCFSVIRSSD